MIPKLCEEIMDKKSSWMISKRPILSCEEFKDRVKQIDPLVSGKLIQIVANYLQDMGEVCLYQVLIILIFQTINIELIV